MAEFGWGLSEELANKAQKELNERPEFTVQAIEVVRDQMETRPDISKHVTWFRCFCFVLSPTLGTSVVGSEK